MFVERQDVWQQELAGDELAKMTAVRDTGLADIDTLQGRMLPAAADAMADAETQLDPEFDARLRRCRRRRRGDQRPRRRWSGRSSSARRRSR